MQDFNQSQIKKLNTMITRAYLLTLSFPLQYHLDLHNQEMCLLDEQRSHVNLRVFV